MQLSQWSTSLAKTLANKLVTPMHAPFRCLCVCVSLAFLFAPVDFLSAADSPPNVIVVMTDDQGYGEFSCHGNPIAKTPNIDRLAAAAIRLADFHVAPMCTPTRGQLMTGMDAFRNAAINVSSGRTLLAPDLATMADVFHGAGYRTGIFGKWHLGDNYPFRPEDRGFEEAVWFPSSHINSVPDFWDNDYFDDTYVHNGRRQRYSGYCTDVFFREAAEWIGKPDDRPFFAYIATNAAHWPWFVPETYREPIRREMAKHPEVVKHLSPQKIESLVSFLAMGANIDENIGTLDQFLRDHQLFNDTIVVFLTDNGSTMGPDYFNAGMRGRKTQLWEGGHRVPCFIRWPNGKVGEPRELAPLSHVQDLLPTLADLAGIDNVPDGLDGVSLAPLFRDETIDFGERMLVINYSRMPTFNVSYTDGNPAIPQKDGAGVLWKKWRLLENRKLYDIDADPHQDRNVAAQHPEVVAKMRRHLDGWWKQVKDDVLVPQRVIIGNDSEDPMMLTACEWLDVFVDQQRQVRRADRKNGTWHLTVDRPGRYRFELRRWPRESNLPLTAGVPQTRVTDGVYVAGESLPIHSAGLRIADQRFSLAINATDRAVSFEADLEAGPTTLRTEFRNADGSPICGAYFVYVNRLD
jgi:arylsulfatase A-like enzyme